MNSHVVLPFLLFLLFHFSWAGALKEKAEQRILEIWPESTLNFEWIQIPPELKKKAEKIVGQKFFRPQIHLWSIQQEKVTLGYAILDNAMGKSMPITFLVILDSMFKVKETSVIQYRESIGGAVENFAWNRQFVGMDLDSNWIPGVTINGISGATISVHSLCKGYRKAALVARLLKHTN